MGNTFNKKQAHDLQSQGREYIPVFINKHLVKNRLEYFDRSRLHQGEKDHEKNGAEEISFKGPDVIKKSIFQLGKIIAQKNPNKRAG